MTDGYGKHSGDAKGDAEPFANVGGNAVSGPVVTDKLPWLAVIGWIVISLVTASLLALAVYLLFIMELFSDGALTDEQYKSLWAFVGVALGTVATLIGALLTYQNQRRVNLLATEAEKRQANALKQQKDEYEHENWRLTLETRVKALQLISTETEPAPPARVTGAVATMMDLAGGPVTIRVLGELWSANKINTTAAVWMIDRVLSEENAPPQDKVEAAFLLSLNAPRLIPTVDDPRQDWLNLPEVISEGWPFSLPPLARLSLISMCARVLLARERAYWDDPMLGEIAGPLLWALDDDYVGPEAGVLLARILASGASPWTDMDDIDLESIRAKADMATGSPGWFTQLMAQFDVWEHPLGPDVPAQGQRSSGQKLPAAPRSDAIKT